MVTVVSTVPHPSVVKEVICCNCGSTLNYVPADVKQTTHRDYTGDADIIHSIECPACKHEVTVKRV